VAELPGGRRLHGLVGWVAWLALHLVYLMGFRNRANVLVNWAWNYLTYDHGSRILAEWDRSDVAAHRPRRRRYQLSE
jgi:NADH:ubiquinone reductase (H+-translocating)